MILGDNAGRKLRRLNIPPADLKSLMHQSGWTALAMIGSCPFTLAVIWLATRLARQPFADYLALRRPAGRDGKKDNDLGPGKVLPPPRLVPPGK